MWTLATRVICCTLITLLLGFMPPSMAAAATRIVNIDWIGNSDAEAIKANLNTLVDSFAPGDVIQMVRDNGTVVREFKLGREIGHGEMGRVFMLQTTHPVPSVVKFVRGGDRARRFHDGEMKATDALASSKIAHAAIEDRIPNVAVVKEYVAGQTLSQVARYWQHFSEGDREERAETLAELLSELRSVPQEFTDIKAENIMFDESSRFWRVIDPGFVKADSATDLARIYAFLSGNEKQLLADLEAAESKFRPTPCHNVGRQVR